MRTSFVLVSSSLVRTKRQDDDAEEPTVDELCDNRPPDEYFRLTTEGDCRDVVRYAFFLCPLKMNIRDRLGFTLKRGYC